MKHSIEITDNEGRFDRFECSEAELAGAKLALARHIHIPGFIVVRNYLAHFRIGCDLNALPLPLRGKEKRAVSGGRARRLDWPPATGLGRSAAKGRERFTMWNQGRVWKLSEGSRP